jgi:hypothetical protein
MMINAAIADSFATIYFGMSGTIEFHFLSQLKHDLACKSRVGHGAYSLFWAQAPNDRDLHKSGSYKDGQSLIQAQLDPDKVPTQCDVQAGDLQTVREF